MLDVISYGSQQCSVASAICIGSTLLICQFCQSKLLCPCFLDFFVWRLPLLITFVRRFLRFYKQEYAYWVVVELLRKLFLTAIVTFVARGTPLQIVIGLLVSVVAHLVHSAL